MTEPRAQRRLATILAAGKNSAQRDKSGADGRARQVVQVGGLV
jgi:hypothetical protein